MAYLISRELEVDYEKAFSSVVSSDIVNAIPPFTFTAVSGVYLLFQGALPNNVVKTLAFVLLAGSGGGLSAYLLWFEFGKLKCLVVRILNFAVGKLDRGYSKAEKFEKKMDGLEENLDMIGEKPVRLLKTVFIAHIGSLCGIASLYVVLLSLGINGFDPVLVFFIAIISSLSEFAPTPGGTGAFEAVMAGMLVLFLGVEFAVALSAAVLFRLITYWPTILVGYLTLNSLNYSDWGGR